MNWLMALRFLRSPAFGRALRQAHHTYRAAVAFIRSPPSDCQIVHVAPPYGLVTGRTTQDPRALEQDYALGRELGARAIQQWTWPSPDR